MNGLQRVFAHSLRLVPRPVVEKVAGRYIAGPALADAVQSVRRLNAAGRTTTIDVLGEAVTSEAETREIVAEYGRVLAALDDETLDGNVSVKLTALGLKLDLDLCRENLAAVVADADARGRFVRIDMEDSSCTDETLRLYRELRAAGRDGVGIVLQACLRRTLDDVAALADLQPSVRLCKGIYVEPPELAFAHPEEVNASFVRCLEALHELGCRVGVATHDERLLAAAKRIFALDGEMELQMLLGVKERLGDRLVAEGRRLRIYVPYGESWYAYSLRRLQENPRMAVTIASATAGRLVGRG